MLNNNNSTGASAKGPNSILVASHGIIALLSAVAIVGNAVVLTAIWKRSFQRTPFHILLSVLAFSDLCTGVATPVTSIPYLCNHKLYTTESAIGILSIQILDLQRFASLHKPFLRVGSFYLCHGDEKTSNEERVAPSVKAIVFNKRLPEPI